jgi:hypothetical protein
VVATLCFAKPLYILDNFRIYLCGLDGKNAESLLVSLFSDLIAAWSVILLVDRNEMQAHARPPGTCIYWYSYYRAYRGKAGTIIKLLPVFTRLIEN